MSENNGNIGIGSVVAAFITGSAVGMAAALLVAPKSGKETREDITQSMNDAKKNLANKLNEGTDLAKSKVNDALETTKTVATESKRAAKEAKQRVKEKRTDDNDDEGVRY